MIVWEVKALLRARVYTPINHSGGCEIGLLPFELWVKQYGILRERDFFPRAFYVVIRNLDNVHTPVTYRSHQVQFP